MFEKMFEKMTGNGHYSVRYLILLTLFFLFDFFVPNDTPTATTTTTTKNGEASMNKSYAFENIVKKKY